MLPFGVSNSVPLWYCRKHNCLFTRLILEAIFKVWMKIFAPCESKADTILVSLAQDLSCA